MKLGVLLIGAACVLRGQNASFTIHRMLQAIGEERYQITTSESGLTLNTLIEYSDRGNKRTTSATLSMKSDYTPLRLEMTGQSNAAAVIQGAGATVQEGGLNRTLALPQVYFTTFGASPFAVQMMMLRYWKAHGKPTALSVLRASPAADPIQIALAGRDVITVKGQEFALDRYTVANLMFGREIVWMNAEGDLVAALTFAGGLPALYSWEAVSPKARRCFSGGTRMGEPEPGGRLAAKQKLRRPPGAGIGPRLCPGTEGSTGESECIDQQIELKNGSGRGKRQSGQSGQLFKVKRATKLSDGASVRPAPSDIQVGPLRNDDDNPKFRCVRGNLRSRESDGLLQAWWATRRCGLGASEPCPG